ncbi:hypothetical protein D3C78_877690 [compost metagenome]
MIQLPESWLLFIEMIERCCVCLHLSMAIVIEQKPIQFVLISPLYKLTEFTSHKHQLFPRKSDLITDEQS